MEWKDILTELRDRIEKSEVVQAGYICGSFAWLVKGDKDRKHRFGEGSDIDIGVLISKELRTLGVRGAKERVRKSVGGQVGGIPLDFYIIFSEAGFRKNLKNDASALLL